jgi:hypothetical protein
MLKASPAAVRHVNRALRSPQPKRGPRPLCFVKRQTWRFLITYFLIRTVADLAPTLMSYATNEIKTQTIEHLTPFKSGSH